MRPRSRVELMFEHKEEKLLKEILEELRRIRSVVQPRLSATLTIGEDNMATIAVGKTGQATYQEFDGPNGTGNPLPPAGPVSFTSSDPTIATVDSVSGLVTGVAPGSVTITGSDSANGLSASDNASIAGATPTAQSATLVVTAN